VFWGISGSSSATRRCGVKLAPDPVDLILSGLGGMRNRLCRDRESCRASGSAMRRLRPEQPAASGPKTCAQQRSYATFGHCGAGQHLPHLRSPGKGANKTPLD
jgi:hypothetical protein